MPSRIAVVTGGTAGLGRATARVLADNGWDVAVLARGEQGLSATVAEIESRGRRAVGISADVADRASVEAAADQVERDLGPIDLWVNDAMVGVFGEFLDTDPEDFERATAVNYLGFVNGTRAALARMVPRGGGHVIQVGSALAHRGIPLQAAYCGAKHAVAGFTESVVAELLYQKSLVRISVVDMPALNTIQFNWVKSRLPHHPQPVAPIFQPEVGAKVIASVAEKPRPRTWVGESTVATVLGNRLAARFMDWFLSRSAWDGQQAPGKSEPMLAANLYQPTEGDFGSRGIFDDESRNGSPQTWYIRNRGLANSIGGGLAVAGGLVALATRRR